MKRNVEILAPAGNYDSFLAAVHAGCDAVYLGGTLFSARAGAGNFSKAELLSALDYAHLHGKKVYMTVNTLLKEDEMERLAEYLMPYYLHGLDAVIVQDVGVLETVAEVFPKLPIHLSTQMTLTGGMGAGLFEREEFKKYFVTRLVPARELSLAELGQLRKETRLELEVFVHGALCVCYSGQCFLSSMIGGRSGNRGRCAQPCRKLYRSLETGRASYLLSPKDLCTLDMIPDLIDAGIDSFKIEGRMKKPEYTAYISWLYRKYANRYLQYGRKEYEDYNKKNPQELEDDLRGMKDLYNRGGFTKGYFVEHNGMDMMSFERPNHEGVLVGKVLSVKKNRAQLLWKEEIFPQDVLEIRHQGEKVYEYTAGTAQKAGEKGETGFYAGTKVLPGMEIYRTRNNELLSRIQENLVDPVPKKKLKGSFVAEEGTESCFTVWVEEEEIFDDLQTGMAFADNSEMETEVKAEAEIEIEAKAETKTEEKRKISITVTGDVCQTAEKHPLTEEAVRKQLKKLGDTEFVWEVLDIHISGNIFLTVKSINEIRRAALESFRKEYLKHFYREIVENRMVQTETSKLLTQNTPKIAVEVFTKEQWQSALSFEYVHIIYARMEILEKNDFLFLAEETIKKKKCCYLSLPQILRSAKREIVKDYLEALLNRHLCSGILVHNLEELGYIRQELDRLNLLPKERPELVADFSMYSTNAKAIRFWQQHGCSRITASIEQNAKELSQLPLAGQEIIIYGHLPFMVSAQCISSYGRGKECLKKPVKTIVTDEWNEERQAENFCRFCYNILYTQKPCSFFQNVDELLPLSFSVWRCAFTMENAQETKKVLTDLEQLLKGNPLPKTNDLWTAHFHKGML
jgi:putative protease